MHAISVQWNQSKQFQYRRVAYKTVQDWSSALMTQSSVSAAVQGNYSQYKCQIQVFILAAFQKHGISSKNNSILKYFSKVLLRIE